MGKINAEARAAVAQIEAQMAERRERREEWMTRAEEIRAQLAVTDDTDLEAEFLARICQDIDQRFGLGSQLGLEWMLDHYMALEFERQAYPWVKEIHQYLVDNGHHARNKLEYFNDCEAFYIDPERVVLVCGSYYHLDPRYLVIDEPGVELVGGIDQWHSFYVRQIWQRTKLNCINSVEQPTLTHYRRRGFKLRGYCEKDRFRTYGDARDGGHVLSYERMLGRAKCDHVIWDVNAPMRFFFEVNTLHAQTVGADT
jgi:hypothetical protein